MQRYEPEKQTSSVLVYWQQPDQWAETIYDWVRFAFRYLSPTLSQNSSIHPSHRGLLLLKWQNSCHVMPTYFSLFHAASAVFDP
jgi:hypothetical protein